MKNNGQSATNDATFSVQPHLFASATSLDAHGLSYLVPNFLTESEVRYFRALGQANSELFPASSSYESVMLPRFWETEATEMMSLIEEKIARLTGIAMHPGDSPLQLAVSRPWDGARGQIFNVHHDTNHAPRRVATVLIYLSDARDDGLEGGETLFPCLSPAHRDDADASAASAASADIMSSDLCSRLSAGFEQGERFLRVTSSSEANRCFDEVAAKSASDACLAFSGVASTRDTELAAGQAAAGEHSGHADANGRIKVEPKRGAALLFVSASPYDPTAAALPEMWHGGCRVRRGEKWTLQQFKELPVPVPVLDLDERMRG